MVPSSLEIPNESISEGISVDELEEPLNMLSADKYDNYNVNYSRNSAKIIQNSDSDSSWSSGYFIKETRNYYNRYLYLLQSNISINWYSYWAIKSTKLMKFAHIYVSVKIYTFSYFCIIVDYGYGCSSELYLSKTEQLRK